MKHDVACYSQSLVKRVKVGTRNAVSALNSLALTFHNDLLHDSVRPSHCAERESREETVCFGLPLSLSAVLKHVVPGSVRAVQRCFVRSNSINEFLYRTHRVSQTHSTVCAHRATAGGNRTQKQLRSHYILQELFP